MPRATRQSKPRPGREITGLDDPALALLAAFLLHPEPIPAPWLHRLAPETTAVDALATAGWIREQADGTWSLVEPDERPTRIRQLSWSVRQRCHRALATLAELTDPPGPHAARHWEAAGDAAAAARCWLQIAESGVRTADPTTALAALTAWHEAKPQPTAEEIQAFATAVRRAFTLPDLTGPLSTAVQRWLNAPPWAEVPAALAALAPQLAQTEAANGRHVAGAEWRRRAAQALEAIRDPTGAAQQWIARATILTYSLHYTAAREAALAGRAAAQTAGSALLEVQGSNILGLLLGMLGRTQEGRQELEQALDLALRSGLTAAAAEAYRLLGNVAEYASCYGDQQAAFARALTYCRRHDATRTADLCLGCLAYSLFRTGHWLRSRRLAQAVLAKAGAPAGSRCVAEGVLGLLHAHRGEIREARARLETCSGLALAMGILGMELLCLWGRALVEELTGSVDASALAYRRLLDFWSGTEDRHDGIPGLTSGALFFADQRQPELVEPFLIALRMCLTSTGNPEAEGAVALVEAAQAQAAGQSARAGQHVREALRSYERRDLVIERSRALLRRGAILKAQGDHDGAETAWREVRVRARRLGARPWLTAAGNAKPHAVQADASGGLSPRQRDVAREVAAGLTNKEIAARLGLSVRTIDMHVGHLLARLGCRGRAEAAARIGSMLS